MNWIGILVGATSFLSIGVFHPIVIKAEYCFSKRCWPVFLLAGLIFLGVSLSLANTAASSVVAVIGMSCLWSIVELFEQEKRVKRGWFPENPKRKKP